MQAIENRDLDLANVNSIAVAKVGLLISGFGDKNTESVTFFDFLAFPDRVKKGTKQEKHHISVETAREFLAGVKAGVIPNKVVSAFNPYIEEISKLTSK